jgi:hypothetical protein
LPVDRGLSRKSFIASAFRDTLGGQILRMLISGRAAAAQRLIAGATMNGNISEISCAI